MSIDENSPRGFAQEDLSCSKREKTSDWFSSLKPSRADAFCRDSGPLKEARECYFTTHPWDWASAATWMISLTFSGNLPKALACWARLIHEIQVSWNGPEELKHANYILRSLPKGLKFLRMVSAKESPKSWA